MITRQCKQCVQIHTTENSGGPFEDWATISNGHGPFEDWSIVLEEVDRVSKENGIVWARLWRDLNRIKDLIFI